MSDTEFDFEEALRAQLSENQADPPEGEPAAEPEPDPQVEVEVPEPEAEPEEVEAPEAEPEIDPAVKAYLDRFGGDVDKALQSAVEAQSLIGRQGTELGDLRKAVEDLQRQDRVEREAPPNLDELIEEDPARIAQWALQTGQTGVYEAAVQAWYETAPRDAARFERALEMELMREQITGELKPTVDSQQQAQQATEFTQAQRDLRSVYTDFDAVLESATEQELNGFPRQTGSLIQTGSLAEKKAALETLYRWVKSGRDLQQQTDAENRSNEAKAAKKTAVVATSTSTPAREEKDMMQLLTEQMLTPPPYSVAHGLQRD